MSGSPPAWDTEGPVQAEVFVVRLGPEGIELTGPCGPEPWLIEVDGGEHPVEVVTRLAQLNVGPPRLVHSTSWRRERDAVVLSFLVVIDEGQAIELAALPVARSALARSGATEAPRSIGHEQVLEHAIRHLAWLAVDDPVVSAELTPAWHTALAGYVPEPFRSLG